MSELPGELTAKPLALIALTGLDTSNAMHRSIWDAFSNNRRPDSLAVQFKLLSNTHEFPTVKPKRNSYEWYIPKGILKRNWMNKYLNEIPSLVVLFYDLDWNDLSWNEKKMECASRVQSLRAALEGRSTKVAVVLIQRVPAQPGSEDAVATERATALCGACELPAKSLYLLPHGDHLFGYTTRLENAFYDLAQSFYHHEYRIIKGHRDQLNKTAHQYLFVRHQFKMGFLNELRQDQHMALKHYQQAYTNLLEIRMVDTNTLEIKTVASFINYKICRIMFNLNQPRDAISQFRAHTDRFKSRTGSPELIFEHHAWMSNQYSTFAELFDEAIRLGLPAVQTQHPGYYFQLAAHHAGLRHSSCKELCKNVVKPESDPLEDEEKLEFYGQRAWRPGKLSAEPADTAREAVAIQALQYREKTSVNHSTIVIGLLGNAISQFKIYRCPRMRRLLAVQMAEEYYNSRDYGKVLTLLMHMLWEYRGERWPVLLTDIIKNALRAAYLATSIQDYLTLALEALGPSTAFPVEHEDAIHANIFNILDKKAPHPEPDLPDDDARASAAEKWTSELGRSEPFVFTIDDSSLVSFIQVKAQFENAKFLVGSPVRILVFIRNLYRGPIEYSKLMLTVSSPGSNIDIPAIADKSEENRDSLFFRPSETKRFVCEFVAPRQANPTDIHISAVSLYLGNETKCCVIIRFSTATGETTVFDRLYPEIQQLRGGSFDAIRPLTTAQIVHVESRVNVRVESQAPALIGEWLPVKLFVSTKDDISDVALTMKIGTDGSGSTGMNGGGISGGGNDQTTELSLTMDTRETSVTMQLGDVLARDEATPCERIVYVRSHQIGDRQLLIKIDYTKPDQLKGSTEFTHVLPVVIPFEITTQFYTTQFEPLTKGFIDDPFIMMPHIACTSPWPIDILETSIELGNSIERRDQEPQKSIVAGTRLQEGESATDAYCVVPKIGSEQPTTTGLYTIRWKRANCADAIETSSSVNLSPLWVEDAVVGLEAKLPAYGWVRTPLYVSYFIRNHSSQLFTLRLTMEASDAFMFGGQKQVDVCLRPNNEKKVEWILRPLVAGFVALPTLSLAVPLDEEHKVNKSRLAEVLDRSLPTHIYIMPERQTDET